MERCTIRDDDGIAYLKAEYDTIDTIDQAIEKLAKYEDAEENGLLAKLPAPIGTTIYWPLMDCDLLDDELCDSFYDIDCENCKHYAPKIMAEHLDYYMLTKNGKLSKEYYLDKDEAEKRLEEIKENASKK